jgi:uncharacterized protein (TIGR02246 family)
MSHITMGTELNGLLSKVEEVITAYIAAWNSDNLDAMFRLFAPDAHWVNVVGMHWRGREAVERAHRVFFDLMFKGVDLRLEEIESVIALPGGVAVAVVRFHMESSYLPDGVVRPAGFYRLTLVLVPDGQSLLIAHGSNVGIVEEAQHLDPMLRR